MQDQSIIEIGKIELQQLGDRKPYELFIQNMFPEKESYDMLVLVFDFYTTEGHIKTRFSYMDIETGSNINFLKYAYRKGSARGGDITFTTKSGDIEKKFKTFFEQQLPKVSQSGLDDSEYFKLLQHWLTNPDNYTTVLTSLTEGYQRMDKNRQNASGFTLAFKIENEVKYLADFPSIQNMLNASGTEEKSYKYSTFSEGKNNLCSVCFEKKEVLHGFGSPFKYATVDKPGMVSGFFRQEGNWKNYPICTDCSLKFELGKNYINSKLNKYFYGKAYYAIPKTLLKKDTRTLQRTLLLLKELYTGDLTRERTRKDEDIIWKMVGEQEDFFTLNLMFYEENPTTKAIKIKLLLEELVPSRFRKLFIDIPQEINKKPVFKNVLSEKQGGPDLIFSFALLKSFYEDDFYRLIHQVFLLRKMNKEVLYKKFMTVLRENYNRSKTSEGFVNLQTDVIKALMVLYYLQALSLIPYNQNFTTMDEIEQNESKPKAIDMDKLHRFITENSGFLDINYKIGIFSVGILVRLLMNIQRVELGSTPFENKLKGYNINHETLKTIYREATLKINQYKGFYAYNELKDFAAKYFILNAHELNRLSNNEISFYFIAGVQFGSQFKSENEEKTQQ